MRMNFRERTTHTLLPLNRGDKVYVQKTRNDRRFVATVEYVARYRPWGADMHAPTRISWIEVRAHDTNRLNTVVPGEYVKL